MQFSMFFSNDHPVLRTLSYAQHHIQVSV